jgi:DNA helicase-2/ATP-dependent DNA helicase PcrA
MREFYGLNPQQRQAVQTIHGPLLILAGAGTGKTRVITCRTAWMLQQDIPAEHILAVTFTKKAAREMQERVAKLLPRKSRSRTDQPAPCPTICTFHALGARILRQHIDRLGYKKNFVIYNEAEQLSAIKKILSRLSGAGPKADPQAVLALLSRAKNHATSPVPSRQADLEALTTHLLPRYTTALRACNAVDFDDLLGLTLRLFAEHPDVLESCRRRFQYVMVDEYQDTNAAQFRLLQCLCRQHRNLCVVGDDDQSIYGWRGAEIANLLDLQQHYPDIKIIKLEQNYRSTNTILQAANALIQNNPRRHAKQLWSENGPGTKIQVHTFETDEEEARTLAEQINFDRLSRQIPWGDQAILFRTNQQSRALEMAFRQAGIRYHLIGGQSYFDRREVRDFLAYLKMLLNPHDDISLLRIANVPPRGLGDATMERLLAASQERHCSVYSAMRHADVQAAFALKTRRSIETFLNWIEHTGAPLHSDTPLSLQNWARAFLDDIGYLTELRRAEKNSETAENRIRNLQELGRDLDADPAGSPSLCPLERLQTFLEELSLDDEREAEEDTAGDAVTLITVHSCKGLEFPHVFVVGLEDGLFPHTRSQEGGTLDEERRLFYVAITRARQSLALSYCLTRKKYGEKVPCHPSPFLGELPKDLVEHADDRARQPVPVQSGKRHFAAIRAALEE